MLGHHATGENDAKSTAPPASDDLSCSITKFFLHLSLFSKQYTPDLATGLILHTLLAEAVKCGSGADIEARIGDHGRAETRVFHVVLGEDLEIAVRP
jgi:hypothetical protein